MKLRITFLATLFICRSVLAQQSDCQFRHLNVNDGLSHNQITSILKDRKGFIWIGTFAGLNRFDGYTTKVFTNDNDDPGSLLNNSVVNICEVPDNKLAIQTSAGFCLYDPKTERFENDLTSFCKSIGMTADQLADIVRFGNDYWFVTQSQGIVYSGRNMISIPARHLAGDDNSIATDSVSALVASDSTSAWIIHTNGILEKLHVGVDRVRVSYRNDFIQRRNRNAPHQFKMILDREGDLWIFLRDDAQGVFKLDHETNAFRSFDMNSVPALNSNIVTGVSETPDGKIWIATDHGGINVLNKQTMKMHIVSNKPEDERSLSQNSITTMYQDDDGIIWLGTFKKGVSYYHRNLIRFAGYRYFSLTKTGLPFGDVNRFAEDEKGNLWIGTNGGGLIYFDRERNSFKQYLHDPRDPHSLSSNVIVSLCMDHEHKLWIGTYYGGLNQFDGKRFIRYKHDPNNPESIADENIWEIFEDSRHRLWVGTIHGGLDLLDKKTMTFSHYRQNDVNSVKSDYIAAIAEDKAGNIWFGTSNGVDMLERETGRFYHYDQAGNGLSDNFVLDIKAAGDGHLWVATRNGLNLFHSDNKRFTAFKESDGLPHNSILAILEDDSKNLWLSTPNGLSTAIPLDASLDDSVQVSLSFKNYDEADGLQGKQFNENAAFKTREGELIFGGPNGFNIFFPQSLGVNTRPPEVVLSSFQLFNKTVVPGESVGGDIILPESISEIREITLPADQNVFSIEFAALSYFNPEKNQYQYMLKGFHQQWLQTSGNSRRASFTNLDPGEYVFQVKASNSDGYWNDTGTSLKITVLPPFWKTTSAFVFYAVAIVFGFLAVRKLIQKRERLKFAREQERNEAIRMHELDMMKIKFFTNVSHEFRTPLTLILTPLEKLLKNAKDQNQSQQFQLIQRNAKRLLNLVNQLLDFRKLEVQELKLNQSEGDIISFIKDCVFSFSDLSEKRDIKLDFHSSVSSLETLFDQDKLEKILFNLLSNAFKFTPEHGTVSVDVNMHDNGMEKHLVILVKDTGIGIPDDKLEKIFERFFQNDLPKSMVNQGSGIGLSITKEFVRLHGGNISVESKSGVGSCFKVELPVQEVLMNKSEETIIESAEVYPIPEANESSALPVLLLVEDNEDFRFYLKDNLRISYRIVEARNGADGWKAALEFLPDLIVSDIMMPELNGIELCKKIKSDSRLSHTPVILLTARSTEEQKLEGFDAGADDYLTKPFNFEILVSRIKNLIHQREKFHKSFGAHFDVKASELNITSLDEQLLQKAIRCVEENISDPDFSVEALSHELGISRAHFYKKVMALTGKSPLEFIRIIRLQQAAQLLEKSQLTVAEIAYKVGFNNPKYFARYFKDEYKMLPSVYASTRRK